MATAVLALSVILQLVAAGLALRLTRVTQHRTAWLLIAVAITLMAARRAVTLVEQLTMGRGVDLTAEFIALAISAVMLAGLAAVGPLFTEMRASQRALTEGESRYRALFEYCPSAVIETDWSAARAALVARPGGPPTAAELTARPELIAACLARVRIVAFNRAAIALFDAEGADEGRLRAAIGGLADPGPLAVTIAAIGAGTQSLRIEAIIRTLKGRQRSVTVTWTVPPGHEASYARLFLNLVDITEQRQVEAQLIMADRMAALGTLAAGVAHEINNPLTYIYGNLQLLAQDLPDAGLGPLVEDALEGARRVRDIVRDLQSFSHGPVPDGGPIALLPVVAAALRMADHELRHRARPVCAVPEHLYVQGDAKRLGQVLLNLIVNAAQAVPPGKAESHRVEIRAVAKEETVVIEVSDTGAGIPAGLVPHVFEPFVTTKSPGGGSGLGLYLCHNIVRSLGGDIAIASTSVAGTTVRVSLPRAAEPPQVDAVQATAPVATSDQRLAVLAVDDEPGVRAILAHLLARHDVTLAGSGREAIAALDERRFDVILCDMMMPDLTGMDVHAHVAAHAPELLDRMIFLTGGAFTDQARAFLAAPGRRSITKPFRAEEVREVVATAAQPEVSATTRPPSSP